MHLCIHFICTYIWTLHHISRQYSTLSADIIFICTCTSFRKQGNNKCSVEESTNKFSISWQCTYIVFILQCPVCKKILNLHIQSQKHFGHYSWISYRVLQSDLCSISVCCALLYIRHRVPGDLICLLDV